MNSNSARTGLRIVCFLALMCVMMGAGSLQAQIGAKGALEFVSRIGNPDDGAQDLVFEDGILFVASRFNGLQIIDVKDIQNPKILSRKNTGGQNYGLYKAGKFVYIVDIIAGMVIFDVSDLKSPVVVSETEISGEARDVYVQGSYAYIAAGQGGVVVLDVSNPTAPSEIANLVDIKNWSFASTVFGNGSNYIYFADRDRGLNIVDISAPADPKRVRTFDTPGLCSGVSVEENYAYIADGPGGLRVVDISNPQKPKEVSHFALPGYSYAVTKSGAYAYVSCDDAGVRAVDVTDPTKPSFDARFDSPGQSYNVIKQDVKLYLADFQSVIILIHNKPPVLVDIKDQNVAEGQTLEFAVDGSDPDGNAIHFNGHFLPEGARFDSVSRVFTWTPSFEQSGEYEGLMFSVTEETLSKLYDRDTVTVTVVNTNRAPSLPSVGKWVVDEDKTLTFKIMPGSDPDVEDDGKLVYFAENLPEGATFDAKSLTFTWKPTFDQSGEYSVGMGIKDAAGASDVKQAPITVNHVNRPPVITQIDAKKTHDENTEIPFTILGMDPDKEDQGKLTYAALNLPQGASYDVAAQGFQWVPTYDQSGSYPNIVFTVSDPAGLTDTTRTTFVINHVNRPPVLAAIGAKAIDENLELTFTTNGEDPDVEDAGKLVFSAETLPEGAVFDPATRSLKWTPTYDQSGSYDIIFKVTDPDGLLAEETVNVVANNINRPPTLAEVGDKAGDENQVMTFTLAAAVDPDKEDVGKLTYVVEGLPQGAEFDPASRTFSWTPTYDQSGKYPNIKFTVSDLEGLTASAITNLTVNHVNRAPVLSSIGAKSVDEDQTLSFQVSGEDYDTEDAGKIVFGADPLPQGAGFNAGNQTLTWKPTFEQSGNYTVTFKVSDPAGLAAEETVTITVDHVNRAPSLPAISAQKVKEGEALSFSAPKGTDPDKEDAGLLKFSSDNLPAGASIDPVSGAFTWTPDFDQSGTFNITVDLKDASGLKASQPLAVTVENVNRKPTIADIGAQTGSENSALSIKLNVNDPDKEDQGKLTLVMEGAPAGASLDKGSATVSWTPGYDQAGSYNLKVKVADAGGLDDEKSFSVTINNTNRKPSINAVGAKTGTVGQSLSFDVSGSDPDSEDGGKLAYSAESLPAGATFSGTKFDWTPAAEQVGSFSVKIKVTDTGGLSDEKDVSITVNPAN